MRCRWSVFWLLLAVSLVSVAAEPELPGRADERLDKLFQRQRGWIGGDGGTSVEVAPQRIVWLFSDTFVGDVVDGRRTNATMVNNTAAVQTGSGEESKVEFFIRRDKDGKATSWIVPDDGVGFYWIHAATMAGDRLLLFLNQVVKQDDTAFGFKEVGRWMGVVENPLDVPTEWRITQHKMPHVLMTDKRLIGFGAAALEQGEYVYIYGVDERRRRADGPMTRYLNVARVPVADVTNFAAWRFFADGRWVEDFRAATPLAKDVASEDSVIAIPGRDEYALVYSHQGFSEKVQVRTAPHPWGPWSPPKTVYRCPEVHWDQRNFCYGAKTHAGLSSVDDLVLTYFTNATDFWHVAGDARLYMPKFVRVPWSKVGE